MHYRSKRFWFSLLAVNLLLAVLALSLGAVGAQDKPIEPTPIPTLPIELPTVAPEGVAPTAVWQPGDLRPIVAAAYQAAVAQFPAIPAALLTTSLQRGATKLMRITANPHSYCGVTVALTS